FRAHVEKSLLTTRHGAPSAPMRCGTLLPPADPGTLGAVNTNKTKDATQQAGRQEAGGAWQNMAKKRPWNAGRRPSKTITAHAKRAKRSWITELRSVRALEEPIEVNDEHLLAAAVAHMAVTFQGK
ncbi:unnamed protein product, partial [Effrenium voratum]